MKITDYSPNSIRTFTGKSFDLRDIKPESICIEDIAHGLSNTARFGGHLPKMFNVAQHSVNVASGCSRKYKLAALLHDASEAYIGDLPSPFKKMMPEYQKIETRLMKVIAKKFGFTYPLPKQVKEFDLYYLNKEWESFVEGTNEIEIWDSEKSKRLFLDAFKYLSDLLPVEYEEIKPVE